jgi:hypothetical protein
MKKGFFGYGRCPHCDSFLKEKDLEKNICWNCNKSLKDSIKMEKTQNDKDLLNKKTKTVEQDFYEKYIEPKDSEKHLQSWYDEDNKCDHLVEETYKQIWLSFNDVKWEELGDTIINTIQENYDLINVDGFYKKSKQELLFIKKLKDKFDYFELIKYHQVDDIIEDVDTITGDETIKKEIGLVWHLIEREMQQKRSDLKYLLDNIRGDDDVGFLP